MAKSTKTLNFKDKYPKRFIEAGIAEASAVSIADGIAAEGGIPFYVNFATFVTGTAWTQVRQSAYANSNVKLIGTYVGMDNGPDGASHHANEDIALMRMIPNMKILIPSSVKELKQSIQIAIEYNGPVYIRVTRDVVPDVELEKDAKMGKAIVVQDDGNDFALIYEGTTTSLAYKSFEILKEKGYKGMLLNIFLLYLDIFSHYLINSHHNQILYLLVSSYFTFVLRKRDFQNILIFKSPFSIIIKFLLNYIRLQR